MPYCETQPPSVLRQQVECFWFSSTSDDLRHRVTPDGCSDILYARTPSGSSLRFVSPMTRFEDFPLTAETSVLGVRFRPGMSGSLAPEMQADCIADLQQIWGGRATQLLRRLDAAETNVTLVALLAEAIPQAPESPVQQAIRLLEQSGGASSLLTLARHCGVSERQFRRLCIQLTTLSPKLLARILRFRHAQQLIASPLALADIALDCGYSDQSHMIADCQKFSGRSPKQLRLHSAETNS